jgi:hypothetical protein
MGKRAEWNKKSRKVIAQICEEKQIERCEVCGSTFGVAPAHKEKRDYYQSAEELADFQNWICLCVICHEKLDNRSKTTKKESDALFNKLRG